MKEHKIGEEQVKLFQKAQDGCQKSQHILFEKNMKLVHSILAKYKIKRDFEDVLQVAKFALLRSILQFDLSRDVRFSTYAYPCIVGEVKKYFRDNRQTKVSRRIIANLEKIKQYKKEYLGKYSMEPTLDEIEEATGIAREDIAIAYDSEMPCLSLHTPIESKGEKELCLMDTLKADNDDIEKLTIREMLNKGLGVLSEKEKKVLYYRYVREEKQAEIAKKMGVSQVHVSRIEKKALEKMKVEILQVAM